MSEADILAFCRARVADTERLAWAANGDDRGEPEHWWLLDKPPNPDPPMCGAVHVYGYFMSVVANRVLPTTAAHIAHHDPERVLASVKADRAMLAEVESWTHPEPCSYALSRDDVETGGCGDLEACDCLLTERRMAILGPMAARDAGHPDYRAEWALPHA